MDSELGHGYTAETTLVRPIDEDGKVQLRCELFLDRELQFSATVRAPLNQLFFCERPLPHRRLETADRRGCSGLIGSASRAETRAQQNGPRPADVGPWGPRSRRGGRSRPTHGEGDGPGLAEGLGSPTSRADPPGACRLISKVIDSRW